MKKIIALTLAVITLLTFTGCMKKYVTDVKATSLSDALERGLKIPGGYRERDENFISITLGIPEYYIMEYRIIIATDDTNKNEIGVFRANNKDDAKEIEKYCQRYVDNVVSSWMYDYIPEENVKIENAKVHVFGIYVIYTFLTPEDTDYALVVIDNLISEGV